MQISLAVTFRHMEPSATLDTAIREHAKNLERFCDDIISCHVIVETPHKHHRKGNLFHIRIDAAIPGKEIVVKRSPDQHHAHEDPYVALRDAFKSMRQQLEDYMRVRRGDVKSHDLAPHGRVTQIHVEQDYVVIETPDGREIYFHRNSVLDDAFDRLKVGSALKFSEEAAEQGPQASSVRIISKHSVDS